MSPIGNKSQRVSTGLPNLDAVLDGLRIGDNVVWRVEHIEDYGRFVAPFVEHSVATGRSIQYLRFGSHRPLIEPRTGVNIIPLNTPPGFETLAHDVYRLIGQHGPGAFYVFDCLSELLNTWSTEQMIGTFFRVICPYLYEMDTVAYFALHPDLHAHQTVEHIRRTTQVLIDLHREEDKLYVQPVKVWQRRSSTMFLPHLSVNDRFVSVIDSGDATRLQSARQGRSCDESRRCLDYWDQLFLEAAAAVRSGAAGNEAAELSARMSHALIGRDERMLTLARRYLTIEDLLEVRSRMIGTGFIGGKAAGMLMARRILEVDDPEGWGGMLEPHDSYYVGSDVYYTFLVENRCWPLFMRQRTPEGYFESAAELAERMRQGRLPDDIRQSLARMLDYFGQYPILVRSSSLLEDGFGNAFAGKYESCFCVNQGSPEERLERVERAILTVFAGTMSFDALAYRRQRGLEDREEPMALLIQRVSGRYRGSYYMPDVAGVGVSRNAFVWDRDMSPEAGMVRLVMGLGTRAVDRVEGDHACVVALDAPTKRPYRDHADAARYAQHDVDVLNIAANDLQSRSVRHLLAENTELPLRWCGVEERIEREGGRSESQPEATVWRLSFEPLLQKTAFVETLQRMLKVLESAYAYPVDIEFTGSIGDDGGLTFNLVQCRPLQTLGRGRPVEVPAKLPEARTLFATEGFFMGGSIDRPISRVVMVDPEAYSALTSPRKYDVARLVGRINRAIEDRESFPTMLMGPGRWGTSTPELGVPVRFGDINRYAAIVEIARLGAGMVPDLSFGSHFFQDLVESEIAYVALFPNERHTIFHPELLEKLGCITPHDDAAEEDFSAEVGRAVQVFDLRGRGVRLIADIRDQRLACLQMDGSGARQAGESET